MLKNYLRIALRNIVRYKGFSFLIMFGLALGLAIFILSSLYTRFIFSYDTFHDGADRIHLVVQTLDSGNKGEQNTAVTPAPVLSAMTGEFPEIEDATRLSRRGSMVVRQQDQVFFEHDILMVDPNFLSFFNFHMIEGDPGSALAEPNSVVLSRDAALKYFGKDEALGKTLTLNNAIDLSVTGILENPPKNTAIYYGLLVSMETARTLYTWMDDWTVNSQTTFIKLNEGASPTRLEEKLSGFITKHYPASPDSPERLFLLPLVRFLHEAEPLDLATQLDFDPKLTIAYFLIAMAGVLLVVVAINFMNLSTSRYGHRIKEIGMRKVVGAGRQQLIRQFLGESVIMAVLSIPLTLAFFYLLRPLFITYIAQDATLSLWAYPWLGLLLLVGILLVGVFSGSYPAFFLSSFTPLQVLKGNLQAGRKGSALRRALVVSQFALSILLIVFALAIQQQVGFMAEMDQGFDYKNVITIVIPPEARDRIQPLKEELSRHPDIEAVATSLSRPINWGTESQVFPEGLGENEAWTMNTYGVGLDFVELLELRIIEGRSFSRDYDDRAGFILNETAVDQLQWEDPLGKTVKLGDRTGPVIGIAEDFLFDNAHFEIIPSLLYLDEDAAGYLLVKTGGPQITGVIGFIEQKWRALNPGTPFGYSTLETRFDSAYDYIGQMSMVFGVLGAVAVFISCLGLVAMAFYTVTRRTREIGVRKVLGASVPGITRMLLFGFLKQVAIANLIAWPLTYFLLIKFLKFAWAYTGEVSPFIFLATALFTLFTAVLSVAYQTIRVSITNPAEALRYE
jgi:putative ABC transport system permease protein